jgi:hypothetical protein
MSSFSLTMCVYLRNFNLQNKYRYFFFCFVFLERVYIGVLEDTPYLYYYHCKFQGLIQSIRATSSKISIGCDALLCAVPGQQLTTIQWILITEGQLTGARELHSSSKPKNSHHS